MKRVYNFSAGPSALPLEVLKEAKKDLINYQGCGMSVMEMSHRSDVFQNIIDTTESLLREIMEIPSNYKVLFLQGGASTQFAMVPMNLMVKNKKADFIDTGVWSKKAIAEAKRFGEVNIAASSGDKNYSYIPGNYELSSDADYVHITLNNTIYGTKFTKIPETGKIPLVADVSSCILSEKLDVSKFGILYAGAQKNLGPAGVTIVIVRDDLIDENLDQPTMMKYSTHVNSGSMFNTPPCFSIYMVKLVLEWIKNKGGITAIENKNRVKADILYDFLDSSDHFNATVNKEDRSLMNVPFVLGTDELNSRFLTEAKKLGFVNLKGHRSVGGMRASIYNAMQMRGVIALVEFMKKFENKI